MATNNVKKVWASGKAVVNAWLARIFSSSASITSAGMPLCDMRPPLQVEVGFTNHIIVPPGLWGYHT